jgi:acyl dehydratase
MLKNCRDAVWFEDYAVGDEFESAPVTFTEADIIDFGKRYDPQPFHIDEQAAKASPFGGLIASGSQILPFVWGAITAPGFLNGRTLGAGSSALEFKRPVRPGDTLIAISRVLATRRSSTRPDRGYLRFLSETTNQAGDLVVTLSQEQIIQRRPAP